MKEFLRLQLKLKWGINRNNSKITAALMSVASILVVVTMLVLIYVLASMLINTLDIAAMQIAQLFLVIIEIALYNYVLTILADYFINSQMTEDTVDVWQSVLNVLGSPYNPLSYLANVIFFYDVWVGIGITIGTALVIYNNLKGKIIDIQKGDLDIVFTIDVPICLDDYINNAYKHFEILDSSKEKSIIRFKVNKVKTTDSDDEDGDNVVPFQVAYATSIHKAQGLEYNSVKIVITHDVEDQITHSIFYTAITRTRKLLKIYWTPETEKFTLSHFKSRFDIKDAMLLANKYSLKMNTKNKIN